MLRYGIAHAVPRPYRKRSGIRRILSRTFRMTRVFGRALSGEYAFGRHEIDQVVNVYGIAARKDAGYARFHKLIDRRPLRHRIHVNARARTHFVFGNESDRKEKRIARDVFFRTFYRTAVRIDGSDRNARHALSPVDFDNRRTQFQRYVEVFETLRHIAAQARRIRHHFAHDFYVAPFEREPPRHDKTDIAASQNDDFFAGQVPVDIDETLRASGRKDARRPRTRNDEGAPRPLSAAHREDNRLRVQKHKSVFCVHRRDDVFSARFVERRFGQSRAFKIFRLIDRNNHRIRFVFDAPLANLRYKAAGVFGTRQLLSEIVKTESVVNALQKNSAELRIAFQNQ